ncbi:MAG: acetyl-CoA hydrolase/transferase C-terminal domain-containing protein [Anaerolineae bacterium]
MRDSIGTYLFRRRRAGRFHGVARSKDGKSIIALPSTAKDGALSRIVPTLKPGAGVTTSRNDVHIIATEYGTADLFAKTIAQRAQALINISSRFPRGEPAAQARAVSRRQVFAGIGAALPKNQ